MTPEAPSSPSPSVLLVDDTPANLLALEAVLGPLGVHLVQASSGADALDVVARESFAVALLDVQMPEMDGFEVARRLRETAHGRELPLIFLTAIHREERYSRQGYEVGGADYITKPFDPEVLRARVKAFVDLYRQREAAERSRLESILTSAPAMIAMYQGPAHTCVFANPAARGERSNASDVVGKGAEQLGASAEAVDIMNRVLQTGEYVTVDEFQLTTGWMGRESQDERVLRLNVQPTTSAPGQVDGVLVFAIDVTAQARARRELELYATERARLLENERAARDAAESANRAKDEFLATVSHELRTPLNAILGWTVIARRQTAGTEVDRALATIERNAQAQTHIIDDVVDISRMTSGKLRMEIESTLVADAVEGAVQAVRPAAEARGVRLDVDVDASVGSIPADAERLQQIVWNLLSNGIKFTPRAGRVALSASRAGAKVVIRVSDTGQGIRPEFLGHLFEPFRQADGGTTRRHGGLGLGLAIVKRLVEAHGGRITARSDGEGRGATFLVELPTQSMVARSRSSFPEIGPDTGARAIRLDGLTLLVVDDDVDAREMLARVLGDQGALVLSAASAPAALKVLEEFRPDVLLSDVAMPAMDGYDLLRKIRRLAASKGGRTPAIALTACARPEDAERAVSAGFQEHVAKPVHLGRLISMIVGLATADAPSPKQTERVWDRGRSQRARR